MSKYVFFWSGPFSQWYKTNIVEGDITFNCAEQSMMYHKAKVFNDNEAMEKILETSNPRKHKAIGRTIVGYSDAIWDEKKLEIVANGNYLKFIQNPDLRKMLLDTGDKIIVEASPVDRIWGVGLAEDDPRIVDESKWLGQNLLGICIMYAREQIKLEDK